MFARDTLLSSPAPSSQLTCIRQAAMAETRKEVCHWENTRRYAMLCYAMPCYAMPCAEYMLPDEHMLTTADGTMCIVDKTISRQHITVEVDEVGAQDCVRLHSPPLPPSNLLTNTQGKRPFPIAHNHKGPRHQDWHTGRRRADPGQDTSTRSR